MPGEAGAARGAPVAAILLAGGTSSRMGRRNKLLLQLEGESLLRRAARRALDAGLAPVVVVLGHEADRAREQLSGLAVEPVLNPDYESGIVTSLRAGLAALPASAPAVVVMLADMPFVTAPMLAALAASYRAGSAPLVISEYEAGEGGVNAPPMLYDRALFGELAAMDDGRCGKQVIKRHRDEAEVLRWPAEALTDLDTPEDLERLPGLLEAGVRDDARHSTAATALPAGAGPRTAG
jgi:molybdenum cofactor cytidylyltransferase